MKALKIIGIVLLSIVVFLLLLAFFIPKKYTVSVSRTINAPKTEVYDFVRILDNQKKYSVWVMEDPNLNPEIIGTDGTVGAIQRWDSKNNNVGAGEQEITALTADRMDVDLRFKRPFEGKAKAANLFKAVSPTQTLMTTEFYSDEAPYPFNLMSYFMGRKMITDAQTKNLENISKILEKK